MGLAALNLLSLLPAYAANEPTSTSATQPYLPPSSLLDLSGKLDNNVAKLGFVTVGNDGHFHYEDGRGRGFGVSTFPVRA